MADRPVLVCTQGPLQGRVITVKEGGMEIGRSGDNDLVLDDEDASRFHARLLFENGSLWLYDAGSRNGVLVNGKRIKAHKALKVEDVVQIASSVFEIQWEDAAATSSSEEASTRSGWWFWPVRKGSE